MLLSYLQKSKKIPKQKAKARLSPELEKKRREILFECFEILLSTQKGETPKEKRDKGNKQYFLIVDDNSWQTKM